MQYFIFDVFNYELVKTIYLENEIIIKIILDFDSDVAVQTSAMKNLFINNLGLSPDKIFIYPVFTELKK